jgi:WD40 repeat protein
MRGHAIYLWPGGFRVQDCAITPDGQKLIAADEVGKLHVYNFATHREEYSLPLKSKCTSISTSRDSKYMLLSLAEGQVMLVDIETSETIRRFHGQKQGEFVIRSGFGGAAENFIVSGSEGELNNSSPIEKNYGH